MFHHKKNGSWIKPKYVPADTLVRYWCDDEVACAELLKAELFQACKDGHVKYRMKEHKLNYPVEVLFAEHNLYIHLESFDKWVSGNADDSGEVKTQDEKLEYWQTVEVDEELFAEKSNEFQREIDEAAAEHERKKVASASNEMTKKNKNDIKESASGRKTFTQDTYEYVIAALDECLMGRFSVKNFRTDKELRHFIDDVYGVLRGISVSNLEKVIGVARQALRDDFDPKESEEDILKKHHL